MNPVEKLLSLEQAEQWVQIEKTAGRRIGFTCGAFDLIHPGHVEYLYNARQRCDRLLVAVNSDASIRRYKNSLRPINQEEYRRYVIAGLSSVDAVISMDDDRPLSLIERLKPDVYIKGGDYKVEQLKSAPAVYNYGGTVDVIRIAFPTSTSGIIERILTIDKIASPEKVLSASKELVILDRDGTIIEEVPFLHDPRKVVLRPGAAEGLSKMQNAGMRLVVATNQQGIGLGYYTEQEFIAVNQQLFKALAPHGVMISKIYFCPHTMPDNCDCRKPRTGMLRRALRDFDTTPDRTVMIGDTGVDVRAGAAMGCRTVYVGKETGSADYCADNLSTAAEWIIEQLRQREIR